MKKFFLILTAVFAVFSAGAVVLDGSVNRPLQHNLQHKFKAKGTAQTRADQSYLDFSYCGDYVTCVGSGYPGSYDYAFIEIPAALAKTWTGCEITEVEIGFGKSEQTKVKVIITDNIMADPLEPLYSQDADMKVQEGWNTVNLTTPFEVTGGKFYVGYEVLNEKASDYPIGVDYMYSENTAGDIFWCVTDEGDYEFYNLGTMFGSVCIRIKVVGDNLPQNSVSVTSLDVPSFIQTGKEFVAAVFVTNNGVKEVSNLTFDVKISGKEVSAPTVDLTEPIPSSYSGWIEIDGLVCESMGVSQPIEITITKVNGVENESAQNFVGGSLDSSDTGFEHNVLVEEFTGTWCGWCPRGIVGMAYMHEKYGNDGFIGIAGHYNDVMQSSSYVNVVNAFSNGFPSGVVDRYYMINPSAEDLEMYYLFLRQYPSFAGIDVTASYSAEENVVKVKSSVEFALDVDKAPYQLAFVLIENEVGPYMQTNSFATSKEEYLEGWSNAASKVSTIFNEVARDIVDPFGISGSLPYSIKKGEVYEYEAELSVKDVNDINNCEVVAMILNAEEYNVLNSAKTILSNAGVESITDNGAPELFKVYNPQGVKVMETKEASSINDLPKGIYIINGKKVLINK